MCLENYCGNMNDFIMPLKPKLLKNLRSVWRSSSLQIIEICLIFYLPAVVIGLIQDIRKAMFSSINECWFLGICPCLGQC